MLRTCKRLDAKCGSRPFACVWTFGAVGVGSVGQESFAGLSLLTRRFSEPKTWFTTDRYLPKSISLLGRLVLVDRVTISIIDRSEFFLPWCSKSGPLQAISPERCPGIVEPAQPELVSPMQVPARRAMSVEHVFTSDPAVWFGSRAP